MSKHRKIHIRNRACLAGYGDTQRLYPPPKLPWRREKVAVKKKLPSPSVAVPRKVIEDTSFYTPPPPHKQKRRSR